MKITLTLELTEAEARQVLDNSIERVMNNAIHVGSAAQGCIYLSEGLRENASTLWQDCEELKPITYKLWENVRNALFIARTQRKET